MVKAEMDRMIVIGTIRNRLQLPNKSSEAAGKCQHIRYLRGPKDRRGVVLETSTQLDESSRGLRVDHQV